ncbi:alpha/beta fold hydrolase [Afifella sp. IM 167]|uniref:alpha/beta fold hydrolase n=1 Tax=Afifella sp. IM 167 TaxID=2033586 RepID=UPI001CD02066|nr:alpha/beta hydrolase [Afifella sp. IM 167]MBZ8134310.1 alpha/beta hydrolase [Afifella sp. IM 167]
MNWVESEIEWESEGRLVRAGVTRHGAGPTLLLLPAPSSISTRREMRGLQERLGGDFTTIAADWPGFGETARPKIAWRPEHFVDFLRHLLAETGRPAATVAAGHGAGYLLAHAAGDPASAGRLCLLSPTWRGPLPTMTGKRMALFPALARAVDLPVAGALLYRLNVNEPVIGMMAKGHVYEDGDFLRGEKLAEKRAVTEAPGARHAAFRFVSGELDLFRDRAAFLDAARQAGGEILVVYGGRCPPKTKADILALGELANVSAVELPRGKLSFYEEFPEETAAAIAGWIGRADA